MAGVLTAAIGRCLVVEGCWRRGRIGRPQCARREGFEPQRQIRSLAAGNLASSWKGSAGWESQPLR